jgi:hypothetical protein
MSASAPSGAAVPSPSTLTSTTSARWDRFTFAALAEQYLAAKKPDVWGRSFTEMQRYLQAASYFKPLHNIPVDSVPRRDVAARVLIIGRESGQVAATRACTTLSGMFSWAMAHGLCEANRPSARLRQRSRRRANAPC